ncbi:MAG: rhodanese-like domain-containing protein [Firmicutes bacterium]|jgi:rhodanese-related sulfurtransferase|uniref:Rhodanese-like domain-containing protein n=1 Tax=Sulfobacillus benefaciens TaxID=453960 RepID=A0A2T2WSM2_9FIRM|nr:rhodanese-like domain-containing protein [Bacillota bacterium]MCL5015492.1 rhodanese-like domain-containing protein [Bacillota bacterium]PSR25251.1 MAG: rhodanese-like domain-containing protein [Sulfobacillus benefaciens]
MAGEITARELLDRLRSGDADHPIIVIDVRLAQIGTIPGARHVPVTDLEDKEWEWDPNAELVVYCQLGKGGSDYAAEVLEEQGYQKVYKLVGGMDSWEQLFKENPQDL